MPGYAFMGKAHSNPFRKIGYMSASHVQAATRGDCRPERGGAGEFDLKTA